MLPFTDSGVLSEKLIRPKGTLVLFGGTLIDGTGSPPLQDAVVVIRDGRIVRAGRRSSVAATATRSAASIDTTGMYLMPGMIDLHVHFAGDFFEMVGRGAERFALPPSIHRKFMEPLEGVRVLRAAANANLLLSVGFTTVRNLGHGDPAHVGAVQHAIRKGLVAGPLIIDAGWALSQTGGHGNLAIWPYELVERWRPRSSFADGTAAVAAHVRQNIREGAECIKIYATEGVVSAPDRQEGIPNFTVTEIRAIVAAAHRHGVRVAAHATSSVGTRNAVLGGVDTIEHGPHEVDPALIELMSKQRTTLVPTLAVFDHVFRSPDPLVPEWVRARAGRWLEGRSAVVRAARRAGVAVAMGSDSGPPPKGGNNARELELLVQAGLSPVEAIHAATGVAAAALGRESELGSIQPGRRADILVLAKDPSADISILRNPANILRIVQAPVGSTM